MVSRANVRLWVLLAGAALLAWPASGAAKTQNAAARATVVKPLALSWQQDLSLGTIILGPGSWSSATISLTRTGGFSCGAPVTCSGVVQVAKYKVAGSNNQTVTIRAPKVTMVNQSDSSKTLTLTVDSPGSVTLGNSGPQGIVFSLGGSIVLSPTTADGTYVGTFNVTVDY